MTGAGPLAGGSGCCLASWADRGCWWWSPQCSPEACWPGRAHYSGPTRWGSCQRWLLSGKRSSTPAPVPAQQFSIHNIRQPSSSIIRTKYCSRLRFSCELTSALPVCARPAAPPAAASPLGWHSENLLQTVEDAPLGQSGYTVLSKTCTEARALTFVFLACTQQEVCLWSLPKRWARHRASAEVM